MDAAECCEVSWGTVLDRRHILEVPRHLHTLYAACTLASTQLKEIYIGANGFHISPDNSSSPQYCAFACIIPVFI
ncbi:UNVERIFIED_CONTAM: hypothetical protein Sangu_2029700 [Sesamum angustifolium]|uniref:Uncharacterized protein n=1 Tax=Sesamum angustifolium TaxID=2727405 RepID=A0AAW2LHI4_9LAMI